MTIKLKLIITFLALTVIPMLFVGVLSFYNAEQALQEGEFENLWNIAEGKEAELLSYLQSKRERASSFASDGFIQDEMERLNSISGSPERIKENNTVVSHLKVNKKPLDAEIIDVHLYDLDGVLIASTDEAEWGENATEEKFFIEGKNSVYIAEAKKYQGHEEEMFIAVSAPVHSKTSNQVIGVLMNSYSLRDIQKILSGERARNLGALSTLDYGADSSLAILWVN
jgi:hypothetical protein